MHVLLVMRAQSTAKLINQLCLFDICRFTYGFFCYYAERTFLTVSGRGRRMFNGNRFQRNQDTSLWCNNCQQLSKGSVYPISPRRLGWTQDIVFSISYRCRTLRSRPLAITSRNYFHYTSTLLIFRPGSLELKLCLLIIQSYISWYERIYWNFVHIYTSKPKPYN